MIEIRRLAIVAGAVLLIVGVSAGTRPATGRMPVGRPVDGVVAIVLASAPEDDPYHGYFCAGLLTTPSVVLTAAHCVATFAQASLHAIVGADNLCRDRPVDGERIAVAGIAVDPAYDPITGAADIAALVLARPSQQRPRRLAPIDRESAAVAFGWGATPAAPRGSCRLEQVPLHIPDQSVCVDALGTGVHVFDPDTMVCADPVGSGDTCFGDSGGPVVLGRDGDPSAPAVALTSWGRGCTGGGAYARIPGALPTWIPILD